MVVMAVFATMMVMMTWITAWIAALETAWISTWITTLKTTNSWITTTNSWIATTNSDWLEKAKKIARKKTFQNIVSLAKVGGLCNTIDATSEQRQLSNSNYTTFLHN